MTPTKNTVIIAARLPTPFLANIDRACRHSKLTRSAFLRKALSYYLSYAPKRLK